MVLVDRDGLAEEVLAVVVLEPDRGQAGLFVLLRAGLDRPDVEALLRELGAERAGELGGQRRRGSSGSGPATSSRRRA